MESRGRSRMTYTRSGVQKGNLSEHYGAEFGFASVQLPKDRGTKIKLQTLGIDRHGILESDDVKVIVEVGKADLCARDTLERDPPPSHHA